MDSAIPVITVTDDSIEIRKIPGVDINAEDLNNTLLTLPAKTYLALYHKMQEKVVGYPFWGGGCGAPIITENETE